METTFDCGLDDLADRASGDQNPGVRRQRLAV
jgi:hypothetical protein